MDTMILDSYMIECHIRHIQPTFDGLKEYYQELKELASEAEKRVN